MENEVFSAVVIDNDALLTLEQFSHTIYVDTHVVIEMIENQLIIPIGQNFEEWRFDSKCLRRAKIALNLNRDLEVNFPGVSLVLELLDKIEQLEKQLQRFKILLPTEKEYEP